jgi:putative membrane protein
MIPYNPKNWFTLIFNFHSSQLMKEMLPNLLGIGALSAGMVWFFTDKVPLNIAPGVNIHTFVGIVLGLVLVFRTNTAYDRWWEGRRLLGSLTNCSRNLAIKLNAILPIHDDDSRSFFAQTIPNFFFAAKEHLRDGVKPEQLQLEGMPYAAMIGQVRHVPSMLATHLQAKLHEMLHAGLIQGEQYRVLSDDVNIMIDVMGGCERIQKTPIPISYSVYIKKVIFIYLITMPFSTISSLGYFTIPVVIFTTYVMAGIELLAEEIEDPFGLDPNDLDSDGMAAGVRSQVQEMLHTGMGVRPTQFPMKPAKTEML